MFEKLEELAKNNKKISDFHIRAGAPLAYRQTGEIIKVQEVMVTAQDIKDLLSMNCNEHELNKFDKTHELDTCASLISFGVNSTPKISSPFIEDFPNLFFKSLLKKPSFFLPASGFGTGLSGAPSLLFFLKRFAKGFFIFLYFEFYLYTQLLLE